MEAMAIPPFERFYCEHCDEVLGYLRRLLGQRAEDAWQETFLRALRAYDRLEHGRHLRAWVFTIATRVAMDDLRRKGKHNVSLDEAHEPEAGPRARAGVRAARALHRRPSPDRARCRRAALRLRPSLCRDRRRPGLLGRGSPGGRVIRSPQTEEEP